MLPRKMTRLVAPGRSRISCYARDALPADVTKYKKQGTVSWCKKH